VQVTPEQLEAIKYLMVRDKVGMGTIDVMIKDTYIEDISCSGLGTIFLEHKIFKGVKSAITFEEHDDLDDFVLRLSEQIKRPVTMRNPIVDATLPDGSRINIVFGREVSRRGSNFSIRKFSETPLSIIELVEFGSISYEMAAYLSVVIEDGMNLFVVGETASGKTTLLNAITTFIPLSHKIVSIEDTPELQVPHANWIREVSRAPGQGEKGATVSMFDLLKASLRQRPNVIIIGEIRGEEGSIAFGAMQTGHEVMSTFHASNVEKLIQRLTGNPINIPKTYIDNLNVVVCQNAVKLPNGKAGRRATSISEIVGYDSTTNTFSYVEVFRWNPVTDTFDFVGRRNSYLLEDKIALKRGIPPDKKMQIYSLVERRGRILEKLHKEKGVRDFYELLKVLARAQEERLF
jgi:flagellar protein FlaI